MAPKDINQICYFMNSVELVILNYNGRKHLEFLLPSAIKEAERYGGECSVVVIDNLSKDPDIEWIRQEFPSVIVWVAPRNEFLYSYNEYAVQSTADILLLLNNDLILQPDFVAPLVKHFKSPDVFCVGATSMDWEGEKFTCGPSKLVFENGFYSWSFDVDRQELCHTFFASGGFMAVDRLKFLELDGFDRIFYPAYCEDLDLCFRAWRKGWRCLFEPESIALHREHGSWGEDGSVDVMGLRNALLFQWRSLPMNSLKMKRRFSMLKITVGCLLKGNTQWISTLLSTRREWGKLKKLQAMTPLTSGEIARMMSRIESNATDLK